MRLLASCGVLLSMLGFTFMPAMQGPGKALSTEAAAEFRGGEYTCVETFSNQTFNCESENDEGRICDRGEEVLCSTASVTVSAGSGSGDRKGSGPKVYCTVCGSRMCGGAIENVTHTEGGSCGS
jgi:hypothetical protein